MRDKELVQLTQIISAKLPNVRISIQNEFFSLSPDRIGIPTKIPEDLIFYAKWLDSHFNEHKLFAYTYAILHEFGHLHTDNTFGELEIAESYARKDYLCDQIKLHPSDKDTLLEVYYEQPVELAATKYGLGYYWTHVKDIQEIDNCVRSIFLN